MTLLGQISPSAAFTVLREVYQHTNIKLSALAEQALKHPQGAALLSCGGQLHAV